MKRKLLCITPDLNRSGAPIALYELLRILTQKSIYSINVMTYGKGDLLSSYEKLIGNEHLTVLNGLNPTDEFRNCLQNDYDMILLNTAAVYTFSFFFQNTDIPVFWWIHEAPQLIEESFPGFPNPHLLSKNFRLFVPSKGAAEWFNKHYVYDVSVLPVPVFVPDLLETDLPLDLPDNRVIFFVPAAYSYIKGQDILLSAILSLPDEYKDRSLFIFCGYT